MRLPGDEELIAYLDGELPHARREEIRRLLEASWEARNRLAALERDIQFYMDATAQTHQPSLPAEDRVWETIAPRLAQKPRGWHWRKLGLTGAIAAAVLIGAMVRLGSPPAISAAEALARAGRAEAAAVARIHAPVVHRTLRVRRTVPGRVETQSAVWEVWRAEGASRVRHWTRSGDQRVVDRVREVLRQGRMDSDEPLSAAAYAAWRRQCDPQLERVELGREEVVVQTGRAGHEGLVQASLTLHGGDWRPVAQHLTVQTDEGTERIELREMEFRVLAYDSLPRNFFASAVTVIPPVIVPRPPEAAPEPMVELVPAADREALIASALQAQAALHRIGECGSRYLEIVLEAADRVDVRGTVPAAERKAGVMDALGELPLLRLDVQVADIGNEAVSPQRISDRLAMTEAEAISLLALLRAITSDAEALRRHTSGLHAVEVASAHALLRTPFEKAVREHLTALRTNLAEAARLLGADEAAGTDASGALGDWHSGVAELGEMVLRSCSASSAEGLPKQQLAGACAQLGREAERWDAAVLAAGRQ